MANQITGTIEIMYPTKETKSTDGTKTYISRELVINARRFDPYTGEPTRDNFVSIELKGEKIKLADNLKQGDLVTASFTLDGNKYTDRNGDTKYFTRINCYAIEPKKSFKAQPIEQVAPPVQEPFSSSQDPFAGVNEMLF